VLFRSRAGDSVVVAGAAFLADGDSVRVVPPPPVAAHATAATTTDHTG